MFDWLNDPMLVSAWGALKAALLAVLVTTLVAATRLVWRVTPIALAALENWVQNAINVRLANGGQNAVSLEIVKQGASASPESLKAVMPKMVDDMLKTFDSLQTAVDPKKAAEKFVARAIDTAFPPALPEASPSALSKPVPVAGASIERLR